MIGASYSNCTNYSYKGTGSGSSSGAYDSKSYSINELKTSLFARTSSSYENNFEVDYLGLNGGFPILKWEIDEAGKQHRNENTIYYVGNNINFSSTFVNVNSGATGAAIYMYIPPTSTSRQFVFNYASSANCTYILSGNSTPTSFSTTRGFTIPAGQSAYIYCTGVKWSLQYPSGMSYKALP